MEETARKRRIELLPALFCVELALGWLWIGPLLMVRDPGLSILASLFVTAPIHLVCMLVAAWRLWRRPAERPWAGVVLATPILLLVVPGWLRSASAPPLVALRGNAVSIALVAVPFAVPLGLCLFAPRRVAAWLPRFVVRSRLLHIGLVSSTALGWLVWIGLAVAWLRSADRDTSGILLGALLAYGGLALLGWAATALYSWVALFSPDDSRNDRLRMTQLALGLPALALLLAGNVLRGFAGGPG